MSDIIPTESVMHDSLKRLVQGIYSEHGLQVHSIYFEWTDMTQFTDEKPQLVIRRVKITSETSTL